MNTKYLLIFSLVTISLFLLKPTFAQSTFTSTQTGDWDDCQTWGYGGGCTSTIGVTFPDTDDNVIITAGHTVTIQAHNNSVPNNNGFAPNVTGSGDNTFMHTGNIDIYGELTTPNNVKVPVYITGDVNVFGGFIVDFGADLFVTGNLHIDNTATSFSVGDDFVISNMATAYLGITSNSGDDLYINGPDALICGPDTLYLGSSGSIIQFLGSPSADSSQICSTLTIRACDADPSSCVEVPKDGSGDFLLPVELIYLHAKQGSGLIDLEWATASEINNAFFTVEKSLDGKNWKELEVVEGMGTSYERTDYNASDESPNRGANYYRLRQNDYDGTYAYSKVVNVTYTGIVTSNTSLLAYPNPSKGTLSLKATGLESGDLSLSITDVTGKVVYQNTKVEFNTYSEIELDLRNLGLKNGIFFLKLHSQYGEVSEKLFLNF